MAKIFASAAFRFFRSDKQVKTSANVIKATVTLLLLLLVGIVVGGPRSAGQEPREKLIVPEDYLPEGEGRNLIFQGCVQCHDLRNTVSQRKSLIGWRRTVNEMIWRGAPLMADEAETITKYLADSFGPDKPIPDALKKKSVGDKR